MRRSGSKSTLEDEPATAAPVPAYDGEDKPDIADDDAPASARRWRSAAMMLAVVPIVAGLSHASTAKMPGGREFSEGKWYSVDIVMYSQEHLTGMDDFLSFVSSASSPSQILNRVVPILACLRGPQVALTVLVAYVAADVSNLALKWPLQGDRPFWMDERLKQFGGNTCEVGFGMPSGHVQVTVAAYLTVAEAMKSKLLHGLVLIAVLLTALSRVHMAAHTPLQVTCGCVAGLATATAVRASRTAIRQWGSFRMPNKRRVIYGVLAVVTISCFIAVENAVLLALDVEIYTSIANAMKACRGGLHAVVSSARGIGRDVGALLGGVVGVCCRYSLSPGGGASSRWSWLDLVLALFPVEVGLWLSTTLESLALGMVNTGGQTPPDLPGGGGTWLGVISTGEGAATVCIFLKYFIILALGVGVAPVLLDRARLVQGFYVKPSR